MPTARWTRIVIGLAGVTWAAILFASGSSLRASWAEPLGYAATIVVLLLLVYDRWVWCWPVVRRFTGRPVLQGTWKTELLTSYEARKGEVIEAYLVIRQTYSKISVAMLFDRSTSQSRSADLIAEDGRWVLHYVYRSEKSTLERDGNPPARGAAELTVARRPSTSLEGDYWTEQGTRGQLRTVGHNKVLFDAYRDAQSGTFS
jgi:hypothetical protein